MCTMCGTRVATDAVVNYQGDCYHRDCFGRADTQPGTRAGIAEDDDESEKGYCMAVRATTDAMAPWSSTDGDVWLLWDSGSDETVLTPRLAQHGKTEEMLDVRLSDVQGNPIPSLGKATVPLAVKDSDGKLHKLSLSGVVSNVPDNVVSVGKALGLGRFACHLEDGNNYLQDRRHPDIRIPLFRRRQSYYIKATVPINNGTGAGQRVSTWPRVAPVVGNGPMSETEHDVMDADPSGETEQMVDVTSLQEESWPEGVGPLCPIKELQRWCKSHGCPAYGTKAQLRERILRRQADKLKKESSGSDVSQQLGQQPSKQVVPPSIPIPERPTDPIVIAKHEETHLPFAPWCLECVKGRGTAAPHKRVKPDDIRRESPVIELDMAFLKTNGEYIEDGTTVDYAEVYGTYLIIVDKGNSDAGATTVELRQGGGLLDKQDFVAQWVNQWLEKRCYRRITLRSQSDPTMAELTRRVRDIRQRKDLVTDVEHTPTRSPQSLGTGERTVGTIKGLARVLRFTLERRLGITLTSAHAAWSWLPGAAAFLYTRFHVQPTGQTPYQAATGNEYRSEMNVFGETVLFQEATSHTGNMLQGQRLKSGDTAWKKGIWVTRSEISDEHIILTADGRRLTRTCRRLPEEGRWDVQTFLKAKGVPWDAQGANKPGRPKKQTTEPLATVAPPVTEPVASNAKAGQETSSSTTPSPPQPPQRRTRIWTKGSGMTDAGMDDGVGNTKRQRVEAVFGGPTLNEQENHEIESTITCGEPTVEENSLNLEDFSS